MTDKHPKRPRDPNQLAKSIIDIATGQTATPTSSPNRLSTLRRGRSPTAIPPEEQGKNPAAVALGKRGGAARAAKMSPKARSAAAKKAAKVRWSD